MLFSEHRGTAHHRRYARSTPERRARYAATKVARNAVRSGRVKREACEVCGSVPSEMHHLDYRKPLSVKWLCKPHHVALHRLVRAGAVPAPCSAVDDRQLCFSFMLDGRNG